MADALIAVEIAFLEQGLGSGINEPRRRVHQPGGTLQLMGGALTRRGYWGFKAYTTTRYGARFTVNLYDVQTGALLALIETDLLGQLRTGAASGIATKHLARPDAGVLALFGTGYQAETQLEAISAVRPLREVRVYSRSLERRTAFAERLGERLKLNTWPAATPREAVSGADIVTTITTSSDPVFDGNDLGPGTHMNAAGSNSAIRAELDVTAIRRANRIFVDDVEQARIESGDLVRAHERNVLNWAQVRPLADVVAGVYVGRTSPDDITLFESHGIALWDIALAAEIYERAQARSMGTMWD
jgi:ornithine cyclodeaminase/alanine dehydrogenase-like protein (mu-crystallin family)